MEEVKTLNGVFHTLQKISIAFIFPAFLYFLPWIKYRAQLAKLRKVSHSRDVYLKSAKKLYAGAYQKVKDGVYYMPAADARDDVVNALRVLPELRKLPDSVLSFPKANEDLMYVKYTKVLIDDPILPHVVRADLTPALARLNPTICEEVIEAVQDKMPSCEDWTPVPIYMKLCQIVAKVSGRVFVGPNLCRNQEYLDAAVNHTLELVTAQLKIEKMRPLMRPLLAPRLPEVQRLREREEQAKSILMPIVEARLEAQKQPDYQKPFDLLQCYMDRGVQYGVEKLTKLQLSLIFVAIHTTTLSVYTLAIQPEYIQPLREEIDAVIADNNGSITCKALQQMENLDSYMKEVFRVYPPKFTSFQRRVLKGFTLSNGQYIPAGVDIEVPSAAIYSDSECYPHSSIFDGFRSYKLRQAGGASSHARNQFVTTNEENLGFGFGSRACPGRFFATAEIKMILAKLIPEYDFKNADGVMERHPNVEDGRSTTPGATKMLLFKKAKI